MTAPFLGQSLLYWPKIGAEHRAATVAHINADETVNLTVHEPGGETRTERRVPFVPHDVPAPQSGGFCRERAL